MIDRNPMEDVDRLLAFHAEAEACENCRGAEHWYRRKQRWIERRAKAHGVDPHLAYVAYALMSWNQSVAGNDLMFSKWIESGRVEGLSEVRRRVRKAERGDFAGALKFKNAAKIATFASNLEHPRAFGGGTMDRHAGDILTGDRRVTKNLLARVRLLGYRYFEGIYVSVARILGRLPHEVQAKVWVHWVYCLGNDD